MKIEIHEKPAAPKYPCLRVSPSDKIILFVAPGEGFRLPSLKPFFALGSMDNFTPFTGSVTLSND